MGRLGDLITSRPVIFFIIGVSLVSLVFIGRATTRSFCAYHIKTRSVLCVTGALA